MAFPDLKVAAGKSVTIDLNGSGSETGKIRYLRPRTPAALKTITGAPVERHARLDDLEAYEVLSGDPPSDYVKFEAGEKKKIGELDVRLFRAVVTSLGAKAEIPKVVRIIQRVRTRQEAARRSLLVLPPDRDTLMRVGRLVKLQQLLIPKWLKELHLFFTTLTFGDVVIGAGATLTIGPSIIALQANNWHMGENARVIQKAPHLTATLTGELKKI